MAMAGLARIGRHVSAGRSKHSYSSSCTGLRPARMYRPQDLPVVMTKDKVEGKKIQSLKDKLSTQMDISYYNHLKYPSDLVERIRSSDLGVLKGLLKDYRNLNREYQYQTKTKEYENSSPKKLLTLKALGEGRMLYSDQDFNVEREDVVRMAHHILKMYSNKQKNHQNYTNHSNLQLQLQLSRVVKVYPDPFPLNYHMVLEARQLDAARVPIKIKACYSTRDVVHYFHPLQPDPFMKVIRKDKGKGITSRINIGENNPTADCEALLFANIKNCPVINKRLGLNNGLIKHKWVRGKVSKFANKDDDTVLSLAKLAVKDQNEIGEQACRRFVKVVGDVWMESIAKDTNLYHIMLVASEAGVEKKFYAAAVRLPRGQGYTIVEWAAASSPRPSMPLPS